MSFSLPTALLLTALALPVAALYLLRIRLRRVPVASRLFWDTVFRDVPPRATGRKLPYVLSLLVQLALLLLLVIAAADPIFDARLQPPRHIVLVIDQSASMQATDLRPSRLHAARAAALDVIRSLGFRDQCAVIAAGSHPQLQTGLTSHIPTLQQAIRRIQPEDAPGDLEAAVAAGRRLLADTPDGTLIVLTDGCTTLSESQTEHPADSVARPAVHWRLLRERSANVGITQFQARRSLADPTGYEVYLTVHNTGTAAIRCHVELLLNDLPVDVLPLQLQPGAQWTRTLQKTAAAGGRLEARLTSVRRAAPAAESSATIAPTIAQQDPPLNDLAVDDRAWAILPSRNVRKVLLVTPGSLFLQQALSAIPLVQLTVVRELPEVWPADTVLVLHRQVPPQLPPGRVLVIDPQADCDLWKLSGQLTNPLITEHQDESPLMRQLNLENVLLPAVRTLQFHSDHEVLAATDSGAPVYAHLERRSGPCLVLTIDLERSDLALRTAFPILIANALQWFAADTADWRPALPAGSQTTLHLTDTARPVPGALQLISPTGVRFPVVNPTARFTTPPLNTAGIWTLREALPQTSPGAASAAADSFSQPDTLIAVNLNSEQETSLQSQAGLETVANSDSQRVNGQPPHSWLSRPLWLYLLVAACLLTTLEWALYQRRVLA